ncbi:MAG TPA: hypothetical protein DCQ36_05210 [Actinobacteria bacterium]|jgi:hypothetical protein|nr:hypothetical protein [Actinomycetota bacterium]
MNSAVDAQADERPAPESLALPVRVDDRARARRMVGPLATAAGTIVGLAYLAAVDPNQPGHYPLCPTQALLSVDCPGCGLMRGTHDLITGDVPRALDHNVLLVVLVPLALVLWGRWVWRSWQGFTPAVTYRAFRRRTRLLILAVVLLLAFGVIRNVVPYLGSGIG